MANFNTIQTSFSSGMVSSKLNGRTDLSIYKDAAEEVINLYPTSEGGLRIREGFNPLLFLDNVNFVSDDPQKTTCITLKDAKGNDYLFVAYLCGALSANAGDTRILQYKRLGIGTWTYVDTLYFNVSSTTGISGYLEMQWVYVGDAIVIVTGSLQPKILFRHSLEFDTFYLVNLDEFVIAKNKNSPTSTLNNGIIAMHYPAGDKNTNPNYLLNATLISGSTYELVIKDAATPTPNELVAWDVDLVTYITVTNSSYTAVFKTLGGDSNNTTKKMRATLVYTRGTVAVSQVKDWYICPWDNINGYPKTVAFSNNRLIFGGTDKFPSTCWASDAAKFYRFHDLRFYEDSSSDASGLGTNLDGSLDSSSFGFTQGSTGSFCAIRWAQAGANGLYIGTSGGVELISSGNNGAFKQGNIFSTTLTNDGCFDIAPVVFSSSLVYVGKDGKKIIFLNSDGSANDLTALFSDYIFRSTSYSDYVTSLCLDSSRGLIFASTNEGKLFGLKLNILEKKWAMFVFEIPWMQDSDAITYSSFFILPDGDSEAISTCSLLKDTTGAKKFFVAQSGYPWELSTKNGQYDFNTDLAFNMPGTGGTTITLPSFLQKGLYTILYRYWNTTAASWFVEEFAGGSYTTTVTLTHADNGGRVGIKFIGKVKTLDLDLGGSSGNTGLSMIKRIDELGFKVWNTEKFKFGIDGGTLEEVVASKLTSNTLFTGTLVRKLRASPERTTQVVIQVDTGCSFFLTALVYKGLTSE